MVSRGAPIAEQPVSTRWTRGTGWERVVTYHGLTSWCHGHATRLVAAGNAESVALIPDTGPTSRVEAVFAHLTQQPTEEIQDELWEVAANELHVDILQHPKVKGLDDQIVLEIRTKVEKELKGEVSDYVVPVGFATTLYEHLRRGVDSFIDFSYVLRVNVTIQTLPSLQARYANVKRVYTTGSLIASETTMPQEVQSVISESNIIPEATADFEAWGWLKKAPEARRASRGKLEISQEYWLAAWSTFLYGAAI